jgi:hypothetical protein
MKTVMMRRSPATPTFSCAGTTKPRPHNPRRGPSRRYRGVSYSLAGSWTSSSQPRGFPIRGSSLILDEAEGDHRRAVAIYEWHVRLSAACFATINVFEVLLRNAVDRQLGMDQPQMPIRETWLMDFNTLQPNGVKAVIVAVERLEKGKEITRSRVVAGVSFGFWAGLFSKTYEELWRHRLRLAFPNGAIMRKDLTQPMRPLQAFRNRVAHHDCLLKQPVRERSDEMIRISGGSTLIQRHDSKNSHLSWRCSQASPNPQACVIASDHGAN